MGAWQGAPGDAVAVHVLVTPKIFAGFELGCGHNLAPVVLARRIPFEWLAQALVHTDVQIGHHEYRRLQPVCQVQCGRAMLEALVRVLRQQHHVFGVAVRRVRAGNQVCLLGARRHAGRGAAALHVDDSYGNLGKVGQPDELGHERNPRTRRGGESAGPVPAGTQNHTD